MYKYEIKEDDNRNRKTAHSEEYLRNFFLLKMLLVIILLVFLRGVCYDLSKILRCIKLKFNSVLVYS